jgi:hypothetical protein
MYVGISRPITERVRLAYTIIAQVKLDNTTVGRIAQPHICICFS